VELSFAAGLPPTLIYVGGDEALRDDAVRMAERLGSAGCEVELEVWSRMFHVWPMFARILPEVRAAIAGIGAAIASISLPRGSCITAARTIPARKRMHLGNAGSLGADGGGGLRAEGLGRSEERSPEKGRHSGRIQGPDGLRSPDLDLGCGSSGSPVAECVARKFKIFARDKPPRQHNTAPEDARLLIVAIVSRSRRVVEQLAQNAP
jgi:hypothetical protein